MPRSYRWGLGVWAVISLAFCLRCLLHDEVPELLVALATLAVWFAVTLWSVALAVRSALRKDLRNAALACLAPLSSWVLAVHGGELGEAIRFQTEKPAYLAALSELRQADAEPIAYFPWGSHPSPRPPGSVTTHGIVHDRDGMILRSPPDRRAAWGARKVAPALLCDTWEARSMGGGFYLAWFNCPSGR